MSIDLYFYNKDTGEYIKTRKAVLDPIDRKPLIPSNAVTESAPEHGENETSVWRDGKWVVVPDFRGVEYYNKETKENRSLNLGEIPGDDWTTKKPEAYDQVWENDEWKTTIDVLKKRKSTELTLGFHGQLSTGFETSLGFRIDSKVDDLKFLSAVYSGLKISKKTTINFVDFYNIPHSLSIEDFEMIMSELAEYIEKVYETKISKRAEIEAATLESEVEAITWEDA